MVAGVENTTPAGWPRPVALHDGDGRRYPVPWNASMVEPRVPDFGSLEAARTAETVGGTKCQTCGGWFLERSAVLVFKTCHVDHTSDSISALDDGLLHRRCARLAVRVCPDLELALSDGSLRMAFVPTGQGIGFTISTLNFIGVSDL